MTEAAGELSPRERRSLWAEVIRWPLSGGMLGGVVLLSLLALASAAAEGGATRPERDTRSWLQAVILFGALAVLGHYAWRAISCTYPAERRVPWGADPQDETPVSRRLGLFLAALFFAFLPLVAWLALRRAISPSPAVDWIVLCVAAAFGAACLPLGLAAAVVKGDPFAAMPTVVNRMRRAEPHAARIAATTSIVFVGLLILSAWLAATFVKAPASDVIEAPVGGGDAVGVGLRIALVVLRAASFYAALVSFRVAGLLVREVPEVREALG